MGAAERITEHIDLGNAYLFGQVGDDLLRGRVQIAAVLHEITRHASTGGGGDKSRIGRRRQREHVIAGAVERGTQ